jgi:hypothetical protein
VSVLTGDGRGGFSVARHYNVGIAPGGMVATDVNADGKIDLVVTNIGSNSITVLIGKGDGTFV